jgi:hypothetical protein
MSAAHAPAALADAGDVNGDGLADAVIGSFLGAPFGRTEAGIAYVVFGRGSTDPVDLDAMPRGSGYRILGDVASGWVGAAVSSAGDFDADGTPDVALGAPHGVPGGRLFLVRGRADGTDLDLAELTPADGYMLSGPEDLSQAFGGAVAAIGDVDGDGVSELAVGDVGYPLELEPGPRDDYGRAYVITIASRAAPPPPPPPVQPAALPVDTSILAAAGPALGRPPWVIGRAQVGATLRCDVAWLNASAVRFTWLRGTRTIPGATTGAYRPRRADAGKALRCRSVAEGPGGRSSATSKAIRIPRVCIVPTVVGLTLKSARARLKARSCRIGLVKVKRMRGRAGRVLQVTPSAGNLRPGGTKVDLVISRPRLQARR